MAAQETVLAATISQHCALKAPLLLEQLLSWMPDIVVHQRFLALLLASLAAYDPAYDDDDYGSSSTSGGGGEWKGSDAL